MPPQYGLQQLALVVSLSIPPALCTLWEDLLSLVDKTFLMQNLLFLVPVSKGEETCRRITNILPGRRESFGHLPPVGGSYGVINERRLNGGTSEGGSTEGRKRKKGEAH